MGGERKKHLTQLAREAVEYIAYIAPALLLLNRNRRDELHRFFKNVEQRTCAINPVALRLGNLLQHAISLKPLDGALRCRKGQPQLTGSTRVVMNGFAASRSITRSGVFVDWPARPLRH